LRRARRIALALATAAAIVTGCGDDESELAPGGTVSAGEGGALAWAVPSRPRDLDPLFADDHAAELAARQIYEPLVEQLSGPFGDPRRVDGLALAVAQTKDPTVWRLRLRTGVRFQDGTPFNAVAVLANVERWQALPERSGLPPAAEMVAFSPKPDEVRFKLDEPDPRFGRLLASPALGIVSPEALRRASRPRLGFPLAAAAGTGPFEARERGAGSLVMARNAGWWGSGRAALGPAIDQLEFVVARSEDERVELLGEAEVQVASGLGPRAARSIRRDPLLAVVSMAGGLAIAAERSVRGIPPDEPAPSLNGVWQTRIDAG
jgi:ABC-type transport system substrate-binding protein